MLPGKADLHEFVLSQNPTTSVRKPRILPAGRKVSLSLQKPLLSYLVIAAPPLWLLQQLEEEGSVTRRPCPHMGGMEGGAGEGQAPRLEGPAGSLCQSLERNPYPEP